LLDFNPGKFFRAECKAAEVEHNLRADLTAATVGADPFGLSVKSIPLRFGESRF
jgi:hypothetical protein